MHIIQLNALKRIEKIIPENAFEQKKKKPGLKFNPGLVRIGLRTTGPWNLKENYFYSVCTVIKTRYLVVNVGLKVKKEMFLFVIMNLMRPFHKNVGTKLNA